MNSKNLQIGKNFPELNDYGDEYLLSLGYSNIRISVFDHILTIDEARNCKTMFYNGALVNNKYDEYLLGEISFVKFYKNFAKLNIYCAFKNRKTSPIRYKKILDLVSYYEIITESLRERNLMDIYVDELNLRILGGFDRTDTLLFKDQNQKDKIIKLVLEAGLYVI